ncbi:MAG: transketolase [Alphaproteobacteria bacterium]|nr:transketolase [Alphaproteobacteria bacterium]
MKYDLPMMATTLRVLAADTIEKANSGHPGAALGMADMAAVLYGQFLKFDADDANWFDRDRVIFSNGHASALVYSLLYLMGFDKMSVAQLQSFRQLDSFTSGHPEITTPGVDFSTGPLGQGIAAAVGMALAEKMLAARWGDDLVNHKTYCFVGDGCLMEGISEEAIELAGLWNLNKLIVLWDDNHITIDGKTEIATKTNIPMRFKASGWQVLTCNGLNQKSIQKALKKAQKAKSPTLIDCKTIIGYGAPTKSGSPKVHGSPLGAEELAGLKKKLNWAYPAFEVPIDFLNWTHQVGRRGAVEREKWTMRVNNHPAEEQFKKEIRGELPDLAGILKTIKQKFLQAKPDLASRKSSQLVLNELLKAIPNMVGGSADLAASNLTKTENSKSIQPNDFSGNYINFGIREHAMGAITNGMAVHGGLMPYASTFFVFSDYMRPTVRLGAFMQAKTLWIFTHDSIGVGEDGPTHQPIEQMVALQAIPNLYLFRPADAVEVAESYEEALRLNKPCALVLSRQNLPTLRRDIRVNLVHQGGYLLRTPLKKRKLTLVASGSEVSLAVKAADFLSEQGIDVAVVSMPCYKLFMDQPEKEQNKVLGTVPRLFVDAGSAFSWYPFKREQDAILSIDTFGKSGPAKEVFADFGLTVENIVKISKKMIK